MTKHREVRQVTGWVENNPTRLPEVPAMKIQYLLKHVFIDNFGAKQLGSNAFITGPGRYRKLGER